jgi:hypothetical protein
MSETVGSSMSSLLVLVLVIVFASTTQGCFSGFEQSPRSAAQRDPPANQATAASRPSEREASAEGEGEKEGEKEQQSASEAWTLICEAERRSGADPSQSRQQRGAAVASWIVEQIKNKKARYWFINLRKIDKAQRAAAMRREAAKAGVAHCALADLLFAAAPATRPARAPATRPAQAPATRPAR